MSGMPMTRDEPGWPEFSIITATYNNATALLTCMGSVAAQRGVRVEHIVIDGGSADGTLGILERLDDQLGAWVSEPDSGISEAMNKGIARARGEWLLFLHADDELDSPDTLSQVSAILSTSAADIIGFPIRYGALPGRFVCPRGANAWLRLKTGLLHQGAFIRRGVFDRIGVHDTTLKIAMDYDFFLRAWLAGIPMATYRAPVVSRMSDTGVSSRVDWPSLSRRLGEERKIHERYSRNMLHKLGYALYWRLYPFYKRCAIRFGDASKHRRQGSIT
jgi:glycosyltransferase involved in cell wall biosynthesis